MLTHQLMKQYYVCPLMQYWYSNQLLMNLIISKYSPVHTLKFMYRNHNHSWVVDQQFYGFLEKVIVEILVQMQQKG